MTDLHELERNHEPAANGPLRDAADGYAIAAPLRDVDSASAPESEGATLPATLDDADAADAGGPGPAIDGGGDDGEVTEGLGDLFDETGASQHITWRCAGE